MRGVGGWSADGPLGEGGSALRGLEGAVGLGGRDVRTYV